MLHLSKWYKSVKESKHLLFSLDLLSVQSGNCRSLEHAVLKAHPLVPRVRFVHTCFRRRNMGSVFIESIFHKSSQYEKINWKHMPTLSPMYVSTRSQQTTSTNHILREAKAKEYITLYFNKFIRINRMLCVSAKLSTFMCVLSAPIFIGAVVMDMMDMQSAITFSGTIALYSALLTGQSFLFFSRNICLIMISTDDSYLKIAHLTLFGKRRDVYVKTSDVLPISGSVYQKKSYTVRFKNSSKKLIFRPHDGRDDINYEVLESVFVKGGQQEDKPTV
uniref:Transmembrane protein 186 n=1 Tax=Arion vulgaris TaxID=1028688 RepID=A0A0B6ZSJ0_9EUPU